jgi:hypothetical protein
LSEYKQKVLGAISFFWTKREAQLASKSGVDTGNRGAVTGGKQLDGFINLFIEVAIENGIPSNWIYTRKSILPGYFRPTKNWDVLIISDEKELVAVIELKSHVGSLGNNFNNRTEEVLGSAVDLWTAYREKVFSDQAAPWVGYLIIVEDSKKSNTPVRISSPHFAVRKEFNDTSYADRYDLLCKKLMRERHYSYASLLLTKNASEYRSTSKVTSIDGLLKSFIGHLNSKVI